MTPLSRFNSIIRRLSKNPEEEYMDELYKDRIVEKPEQVANAFLLVGSILTCAVLVFAVVVFGVIR